MQSRTACRRRSARAWTKSRLGLIVEELVRVAAHHIYVEGYPTQDQVKIRQDRQRNQLHEIKALAARIDALEGREGAADDS